MQNASFCGLYSSNDVTISKGTLIALKQLNYNGYLYIRIRKDVEYIRISKNSKYISYPNILSYDILLDGIFYNFLTLNYQLKE